MLPYVTVGTMTIPMYGVCGAVGFLAALALIAALAPRVRVDAENAVYLFVFAVIGAMAGAKVLYLLTVAPQLLRDLPMAVSDPGGFIARYLSGGFVFYGGLIGGVAVAVLYCRWFRWRPVDYLPALVPAIPLLHAFGRIGCFCAGCCYGIPVPWGLRFDRSPVAPHGVALLPVQLVESAAEFVLCAVLVALALRHPADGRHGSRGGRGAWLLLAWYGALYAPLRFGLEFLRGDAVRGFWLGLSTSQWLSLAVFAASLAVLLAARRTAPAVPASPAPHGPAVGDVADAAAR